MNEEDEQLDKQPRKTHPSSDSISCGPANLNSHSAHVTLQLWTGVGQGWEIKVHMTLTGFETTTL